MSVLRFLIAHRGEFAAKKLGKIGTRGFASFRIGFVFVPNLAQFAVVQPEAAALGTFIHFNFSFGAEEVAHHHRARAMRTVPPFRVVHSDRGIALNV